MALPKLPPRESAEFIARNALDVKINPKGVERVAKMVRESVERQEFSISTWKQHKLHPKVADRKAIDWIFVVDTMNFSFWTEDGQAKYAVEDSEGELQSGYWALCAAINRAEQDGLPICDPVFYSKISLKEVSKVFRSATETTIPLLDERKRILNETGTALIEKFGGSFIKCVLEANGSAKKLIEIVVQNFPSYRDEAIYEGVKVSLYKRAQILVADIWSCFEGQSLGEFHDIEVLTMFPDYRVPQVLVFMEAMQYSPSLLQRLKNGQRLENGSREEVEIRGTTIWAVELLYQELLKCKTRINSVLIDFYLWDYRRQHSEELEHVPYHKTRSVFY